MNQIIANKYISEMKNIKKENLEELYLIFKYSFENIIDSILDNKFKSNIPKQCLNIINEFRKIILAERKILNFLISHIDYVEEYNLDNFIGKLDELNEQTINYYYNYLDNMEESYQPKRNFKFLYENNDLKQEASNLILSKEFLKSYLGYEEAFWTFIDARSVFSDEITDYQMDCEYILGNQLKIKLTLPEIKDLETALNCVKAYNKAHILYIFKNKTQLDNPSEKIKKYYKKVIDYLNVE